jgi:hypothetical protein
VDWKGEEDNRPTCFNVSFITRPVTRGWLGGQIRIRKGRKKIGELILSPFSSLGVPRGFRQSSQVWKRERERIEVSLLLGKPGGGRWSSQDWKKRGKKGDPVSSPVHHRVPWRGW